MVYQIVDLGFGDAGKGALTDHLVRSIRAPVLCVRYNGGAQAAHNVITPDGRHHTFSQFGAGMFVDNAKTYLSEHFMLHPEAMLNEAEHLEALGVSPLPRTTIHPDVLITTPYHQAANQIKETRRGNNRHGSCGMGIGETRRLALKFDLAIRLSDPITTVSRKLLDMRDFYRSELREDVVSPGDLDRFMDAFVSILRRAKISELPDFDVAVFEGAQGVLLDEYWGFHPHTTWSNCTLENADCILEGYDGEIERIGLTRAYSCRHGAGPFPAEHAGTHFSDEHNKTNDWQGLLRTGPLDMLTLRYALNVVDVDVLCLSHLDQVDRPHVITEYLVFLSGVWDDIPHRDHATEKEHLSFQQVIGNVMEKFAIPEVEEVDDLPAYLEAELRRPVKYLGWGPNERTVRTGHMELSA